MSTTTINNQVINLSAENIKLLKEYKQEAFSAFADLEIANQQMKDILNAAHDKTGIEKKDIKCFFSYTRYSNCSCGSVVNFINSFKKFKCYIKVISYCVFLSSYKVPNFYRTIPSEFFTFIFKC